MSELMEGRIYRAWKMDGRGPGNQRLWHSKELVGIERDQAGPSQPAGASHFLLVKMLLL